MWFSEKLVPLTQRKRERDSSDCRAQEESKNRQTHFPQHLLCRIVFLSRRGATRWSQMLAFITFAVPIPPIRPRFWEVTAHRIVRFQRGAGLKAGAHINSSRGGAPVHINPI